MKFRSLTVLAFVLSLLCAPSMVQAQNPCSGIPQDQFVFNPNTLYWVTDDFQVLEADGSFRISGLRYAVFAVGANPATATPVQGPSSIPRGSITLVPGTTNCYRVSLPALIPTSQSLVMSAKQYRDANAGSGLPAAESAWSGVSNPFGSAPTVLPAVGAVRVGQ